MGEESRGATTATKRRAPLWAKILLGVGAFILVVAGGVYAYAMTLVDKVNDIPQENILGFTDEDGEVDGPINLLMVGADLRVDSSEPARADTIMVLHINKELNQANIVSIPRDLRVEIPDCGEALQSPCTDKINAAYTYGGPDPAKGAKNLADTITQLTGIEFNGVALVNFEGFLDVVKTFGGIELCLPQDLQTAHGGFYPQGCQRYNPDDALAIVRERYAWNDGDYGRQRMQQHFIKQLLKEADAQGYIKDPTKVGGLIDEIGSQLILDLGGIAPVDYAFALSGIEASKMQNIKLPSEPASIDGTSYVVINEGEQQADADALFDAVKSDSLDKWIKDNPDYLNEDPSGKD